MSGYSQCQQSGQSPIHITTNLGQWLRLSNARRCLGTREPREFGAGPIGILTNLSELVVHEIEAAAERALQRQQSEKLLAAMDLYQDAFMLVDTTVAKWRILHLNLMAANQIGELLPQFPCSAWLGIILEM